MTEQDQFAALIELAREAAALSQGTVQIELAIKPDGILITGRKLWKGEQRKIEHLISWRHALDSVKGVNLAMRRAAQALGSAEPIAGDKELKFMKLGHWFELIGDQVPAVAALLGKAWSQVEGLKRIGIIVYDIERNLASLEQAGYKIAPIDGFER